MIQKGPDHQHLLSPLKEEIVNTLFTVLVVETFKKIKTCPVTIYSNVFYWQYTDKKILNRLGHEISYSTLRT